ncbi:FhaA domain-containing protein [Calidifontibacter terrae]
MGLFDKLEQRLERGVNGAFARAFRSEVQPVEVASAIRRAMDDRATSAGKNKRQVVPNLFDVELSETDYDQLTVHVEQLADELKASAAEHAETQRYTPGGPLTVTFSCHSELETGVFRLRPSVARQAVPTSYEPPARVRRRPEPEPVDEEIVDDNSTNYYVEPEPPAPAPERRVPLAPTPAAPRSYRQRPYLDLDGTRCSLVGAITVIGRDDDADIVLDDSGISRRHSEIRVTNDGPHLVASLSDLGSTNGTFVNGDRITSVHLNDGDRITVGRTSMVFHQGRRG